MPAQLAFDLPVRVAMGRGDFFVSAANAAALATLDGWRDWPLGKLVLVGPEGAGKSHLAHVWAEAAGARLLPAAELSEAALPGLVPEGTAPRLCLDDADRLAGQAGAERALFHLHNLVLAQGGRLLLTGASPPARWGIALPDLASRVAGTALAVLDPPDDALLSAVLVKQFADRQIAVAPALIPYLVQRMPRSFAAARSLVTALDALALARGRAVTRALAAEVLDLTFPDRS